MKHEAFTRPAERDEEPDNWRPIGELVAAIMQRINPEDEDKQ